MFRSIHRSPALSCALAALLLLATAIPVAAAKRPRRSCSIPGSVPVVANKAGAVVKVVKTVDGAAQTTYYGCLKRVGRRFVLRAGEIEQAKGPVFGVRLVSPFAALAVREPLIDAKHPNGIYVFDLRTGKVFRKSPNTTGNGFDAISDLELTRSGAVAWINFNPGGVALFGNPPTPPQAEVHRIDRRGERMLDAGPGIQSDSLTVTSGTVSWVNNGRKVTSLLR